MDIFGEHGGTISAVAEGVLLSIPVSFLLAEGENRYLRSVRGVSVDIRAGKSFVTMTNVSLEGYRTNHLLKTPLLLRPDEGTAGVNDITFGVTVPRCTVQDLQGQDLTIHVSLSFRNGIPITIAMDTRVVDDHTLQVTAVDRVPEHFTLLWSLIVLVVSVIGFAVWNELVYSKTILVEWPASFNTLMIGGLLGFFSLQILEVVTWIKTVDNLTHVAKFPELFLTRGAVVVLRSRATAIALSGLACVVAVAVVVHWAVPIRGTLPRSTQLLDRDGGGQSPVQLTRGQFVRILDLDRLQIVHAEATANQAVPSIGIVDFVRHELRLPGKRVEVPFWGFVRFSPRRATLVAEIRETKHDLAEVNLFDLRAASSSDATTREALADLREYVRTGQAQGRFVDETAFVFPAKRFASVSDVEVFLEGNAKLGSSELTDEWDRTDKGLMTSQAVAATMPLAIDRLGNGVRLGQFLLDTLERDGGDRLGADQLAKTLNKMRKTFAGSFESPETRQVFGDYLSLLFSMEARHCETAASEQIHVAIAEIMERRGAEVAHVYLRKAVEAGMLDAEPAEGTLCRMRRDYFREKRRLLLQLQNGRARLSELASETNNQAVVDFLADLRDLGSAPRVGARSES